MPAQGGQFHIFYGNNRYTPKALAALSGQQPGGDFQTASIASIAFPYIF